MTRDTLIHLRFDEADATLQPSDAKGNLTDLTGLSTLPALVDGFTGKARAITETEAMTGVDVVPGSTLATRDVTVQAIVRWDFDRAISSGYTTGTIIQRGAGDLTAAEAVAYMVQLRVVNAALRIAELRFGWMDVAGTSMKLQLGGYFVVPSSTSSGWLMLTATRHWISATEVEIQYYVGAQLVGEHFSTDGSIGGGTTGLTRIGVRTQAGSTQDWFEGDIDELRVLNYHVTQEEVEATWLRLSKWQPSGYTTVKQLLPPKAPVSGDPTSRIQRLLKGIGHGLGFADAQVDNMRRNMMPDRAYGPVLERWETITGEAPRALDTTKQRRTRVVSHFQQRQGVSPPGVRAAIKDQLQLNADQIPLYAFSNDLTDAFATTIDQRVWWQPNTTPIFTHSSSAARAQLGAGTDCRVLGPGTEPWKALLGPLDGNGRDAHIVAKLTPTTIGADSEAGICFYNAQRGDALFMGMRNVGGVYRIVYEELEGGTLQGATTLDTVALAAIHLHMFHRPQPDSFYANVGTDPITGSPISDGGRIHLDQYVNAGFGTDVIDANFTFQWDTNRTNLGATQLVSGAFHRARYQWAGFYVRTVTSSGGAVDVLFDDVIIRSRYGTRPFRWYGYRDPALPGTPDMPAAQATAQRLAHAHTFARVVGSVSAKCDDSTSLCDTTPIGGF